MYYVAKAKLAIKKKTLTFCELVCLFAADYYLVANSLNDCKVLFSFFVKKILP